MKSSSYETILFDWDGTLVDTLGYWHEAFEYGLSKRDIQFKREDTLKQFFSAESSKTYGVTDIDSFVTDIYEYFTQKLSEIELHPHVIETLTSLKKRGKNICIVTTSSREIIHIQKKRLLKNIEFDATVCWEDVDGKPKPHPYPIELAIKRLGANPHTTLMIGDNELDIRAAQAAQVCSVWYHPTANHLFFPKGHFAHHKPDMTLSSFEELLEVV